MRRAGLRQRLDRHLPVLLALGCLAALLAIYQLRVAHLPRGIWLDEAWLLNSVRAPTLHAAIFYEDWAQTTPPLFVVLLRALHLGLGLRPAQLLFVPIAFGVASLPLFWLLARRVLSAPYAALALLLFASSPLVWCYAQILKPYSSDVFAALLCTLLGLRLVDQPSGGRLAAWVATVLVAYPLSYTVVFLIPGVLLLLLVRPARRDTRIGSPALSARTVAWAAALIAVVVGAVHVGIVQPNAEIPALQNFWQFGFVDFGNAYLKWMLYLFVYHALRIFPLFAYRPHSVPLGRAPDELGMVLAVGALLALGVLGMLAGGAQASRRRHFAFIALLLPAGLVILLNVARLYPLRETRLTLFLAPAMAIAICAGLRVIVTALCRLTRSADRGENGSAGLHRTTVLLLAGALSLALGARQQEVAAAWLDYPGREDVSGALRAIAQLRRPDDLVYVHASLQQHLPYHAAAEALRGKPLMMGNLDWPCCSPRRRWERDKRGPDVAAAAREAKSIAQAAQGRRVWLVVSQAHVSQRRRMILGQQLGGTGYREDWTGQSFGIEVRRFSPAHLALAPQNPPLRVRSIAGKGENEP